MHGYPEVDRGQMVRVYISVAVRVRVRAGDENGYFLPFFKLSILKSDRHFCVALMAWGLIRLLLSDCAWKSLGMTQETRVQ